MAAGAELRVVPHTTDPTRQVCEVWWDGKFVASVTTHVSEGWVRVISKHDMIVLEEPKMGGVNVATVRLLA